MRYLLLIILFCVGAVGASAGPTAAVKPYEASRWPIEPNGVDTHVLADLGRKGIKQANPCSDEVFLRRVYLDLIGTLPRPEETRAFLDTRGGKKRAELVDALLKRDEFVDYWTLKWCDLLRVKAEFPINLWPNAVQAYHRWIHDSIRDGKPYDDFARELLTASGSNFRVPAVNFYRAVQGREPSALAAAVALTFMGVRFDTWPQQRRTNMEAFFSRVAYKGTAEWKEEIVCLDPSATEPLNAILPDGVPVTIPPDQDPRKVFADWLIQPENPWFAQSVTNRVWAWLMGRGIVHEPDDFRSDNPPVNPNLLAYLGGELVAADYDLRQVFRVICNSQTYQQSSIPQSTHAEVERRFGCYAVRRLDAEVLIDALCWLGGDGESYSSPIPEPFTYVPESQRTIALADGSISSQFLEMFGRPSRDTGLESERSTNPTDGQRLYLLNSSDVQRRLQQSPLIRKLLTDARWDRAKITQALYLLILSRDPTEAELSKAEEYLKAAGRKVSDAANDLAWALVNTKEFLYRH